MTSMTMGDLKLLAEYRPAPWPNRIPRAQREFKLTRRASADRPILVRASQNWETADRGERPPKAALKRATGTAARHRWPAVLPPFYLCRVRIGRLYVAGPLVFSRRLRRRGAAAGWISS